MSKLLTLRFFLCLLFILPVSTVAHAENHLSLESAINKAGRQRMLSQRIVVKYVQLGQNLFTDVAEFEMHRNIELFDNQLRELKALKVYSDDEVLAETLDWVTTVWLRFRTLALKEVSQQNIRQLYHLSEDLLYGSNKVVLILQDLQNKPVHRLVNISGRQRMLSQRLAKYYLLRNWGFNSLATEDLLLASEKELENALEVLRTAEETTDEIRELLEIAIIQWTWFKSVIGRDPSEGDFRLIVVDTSNNLLDVLEHITDKYEQIARPVQ